MIERLHAIQETAQYLISRSRSLSRREKLALFVMIRELAKLVEDSLTRETFAANLALSCLKQIQAEVDEPGSPDVQIALISRILKEYHRQDIPC